MLLLEMRDNICFGMQLDWWYVDGDMIGAVWGENKAGMVMQCSWMGVETLRG